MRAYGDLKTTQDRMIPPQLLSISEMKNTLMQILEAMAWAVIIIYFLLGIFVIAQQISIN
jgi:hypothetical protein